MARLYCFYGFDVPKFEWYDSPLPAVRKVMSALAGRSAVRRSSGDLSWREFENRTLYARPWDAEKHKYFELVNDHVARWHTLVSTVLFHQCSDVPDFAYGNADAFDSCLLELSGKETEYSALFRDTVWHCGWWRPTPRVCFMIDRPIELELDDSGRVHRKLKYSDGFTVHAIHGVAVPDYIATGQFNAEDIDRMRNVEVRRVMIEDFGMERYLRETNAQEIQRDQYGVLYRRVLDNDEPLVIVKVRNSTAEADGTYKDYFLRVPPDITTARQGVAWTFEMKSEDYSPKKET